MIVRKDNTQNVFHILPVPSEWLGACVISGEIVC